MISPFNLRSSADEVDFSPRRISFGEGQRSAISASAGQGSIDAFNMSDLLNDTEGLRQSLDRGNQLSSNEGLLRQSVDRGSLLSNGSCRSLPPPRPSCGDYFHRRTALEQEHHGHTATLQPRSQSAAFILRADKHRGEHPDTWIT